MDLSRRSHLQLTSNAGTTRHNGEVGKILRQASDALFSRSDQTITHLPRLARITLLALVSAALIATAAFFSLGVLTPRQALVEVLVLIGICGFAWRPVVALLSLLVIGVFAIPADGGVYALVLAVAFGLVVYTTGRFWTFLYGACVIMITLTGEYLTEHITFGGSLVVTATGAAAGLIGWGLKQSLERERSLSNSLTEMVQDRDQAVQAERIRIADELHNIVAHDITLVLMHVRAHRLVKDEKQQHHALETIEQAAEQALTDIHRMLRVVNERPVEDLDPTPISDVLQAVAHELDALGIATTVALDNDAHLSALVNTTLNHIARECTTNIIKHAPGASQAWIQLEFNPGTVSLCFWNEIAPDTPPAVSSRYGLNRLEERVKLLGGNIAAHDSSDGWLVRVTVPAN